MRTQRDETPPMRSAPARGPSGSRGGGAERTAREPGGSRPAGDVGREVAAELESGSEPGRARAAALERRIAAREALVAVVGLGYVGRPLARAAAAAGFGVLAHDTAPERARALGAEEAPGLRAVREPAELGRAEVILICVPTPLAAELQPDLSHVRDAARAACAAVARHRAEEARTGEPCRGVLVVLESTTWPGSTREVVGAELAAAGLALGRDAWLAHSPERLDPGTPRGELTRIPKLVGGTCARSGELAADFYRAFVEDVHVVTSAEVAESAKLLENVFRAVNIALVNELKVALEALGVDVWEVVEAAATKPFGFMKFTPGPGMGGHCLPVDPFYLAWALARAGRPSRFIELAGEINRDMPGHVVRRTAEALAARGVALDGARVLVLGLAYKAGVDDVRESPAVRLIELFTRRGASVRYHDPRVPRAADVDVPDWEERDSIALDAESLAGFDAVVLATAQPELDLELVAAHAPLVVDTRGVLRERMAGDPRLVRA